MTEVMRLVNAHHRPRQRDLNGSSVILTVWKWQSGITNDVICRLGSALWIIKRVPNIAV